MNGLRSFAKRAGANVDYYPLSLAGDWNEKWNILVCRLFPIQYHSPHVAQQKVSDLKPSSTDWHPGLFCLTGKASHRTLTDLVNNKMCRPIECNRT